MWFEHVHQREATNKSKAIITTGKQETKETNKKI